MNYDFSDGKVILSCFDSFDIGQTLECGQCFRFVKLGDNHYRLIAFGRVLEVVQTQNDMQFFPCTLSDFEDIWIDYFDLKRNYTAIKEIISDRDLVLRDAVEFAPGIRILNQDPWETLISFIISQNKQIPQIKQVVQNLSAMYGSKIEGSGEFSFPTVEQLQRADVAGIMACKAGFRAKYIMDAVEKVSSGAVCVNRDNSIQTTELKESLLNIKGVGTKVSDCVLLFGFSRYEYFPTDVWVKRIMEHFYFGGNETGIDAIHQLAKERFGEYAGFAQQYLFNYARSFGEIFKKQNKTEHY